jgi:hypothetical protein
MNKKICKKKILLLFLQLTKKRKLSYYLAFSPKRVIIWLYSPKRVITGFIAQKVLCVCRLLSTDSHLLRGERARPPLHPKLVGNRSKFTPNNKKFVKKLVLLCFQNKTSVSKF